jgi:hypothetical protein
MALTWLSGVLQVRYVRTFLAGFYCCFHSHYPSSFDEVSESSMLRIISLDFFALQLVMIHQSTLVNSALVSRVKAQHST